MPGPSLRQASLGQAKVKHRQFVQGQKPAEPVRSEAQPCQGQTRIEPGLGHVRPCQGQAGQERACPDRPSPGQPGPAGASGQCPT